MLLIDLKLVIFALLALALGLGAALWAARRRAGERRLPLDVELLPFGVAELGAGGDMLRANAEARRLLADGKPPRALGQAALSARASSSGMLAAPQPLRWWAYPLAHGGALLILADNAEQQRQIARQQAFVGLLAHELRTPLTAVIAHLELARAPASPPALREASLATAHGESQRMARLVRDMLELHRLELSADLPLEPANLALLAESAISQLFPRAEAAQVELALEVGGTLPAVLAHPDRLRQVFLNLLDNAIKYARPGDSVTVSLQPQAGGVRCRVADTGPGIPAADLPHVCEPLYRARADVEGSGLGLALVREILLRHHATLEIASATGAGSGTTCSWVLPMAGEAAP
ncbi:hypothetical protein F8S13_10820 [Chloroflexia bacterium SDU3-3]|nr:hypothetical protein F8S13_10820 [Chloroflexia bacterium SDU3-3]